MTTTLPPHIARPSRDLVGPVVYFRSQPVAVTSSPPRDTADPRYDRCTDHHLACDCREAEQNEQLAESRMDRFYLRDQLEVVIVDHPTEVYINGDLRPDMCCQCEGCKLARSLSLVPFRNVRYLTIGSRV
ncbi:hypothetical protein [Nocardia vaccinii]|uniref:hypothetical protein n=1 Tax=Nocardia vaccinii TaxID=1822 RepID=UPI000829E554|nr:hypothetical protein [Nocardia vaccinii]